MKAMILTIIFAITSAFALDRAAWMPETRWGVMNHYLADWIVRRDNMEMSVEKWNELIDNFDVDGLAGQIEVKSCYFLARYSGQKIEKAPKVSD